MELLKSNKLRVPLAILGGIAIGAGGTYATQDPKATGRLAHAFEQKYTDTGKCLHGTPFDPAKGAFIDVHRDPKSNEDILRTTPLDANYEQPAVLSFSVHPHERFLSADQLTLAFVGNLACPDASAGS